MVTDKKFIEYNKRLQDDLNAEIVKVKKGESNKNPEQLQMILRELKDSEKKTGLKLYYPHIIIDSWEHSDALGADLMRLYRIYDKLK